MAISGIFAIQNVYHQQVSATWPTTAYVPIPQDQEFGWFGGGSFSGARLSRVDRISYASDTSVASVRGPLSLNRTNPGATGNASYGWFGGGFTASPVSSVDRINYAVDTATAEVRGPLSLARLAMGATGNANYGWFGAGAGGPFYSTVDRIDYLADTVTAAVRGSLSVAKYLHAATGNANYGWFGGGYRSSPVTVYSGVDRITYASDLTTSATRGPLSRQRYWLSAAGNANYGWFVGGFNENPSLQQTSTVDRIDYAADTASAAVRSPMGIGNIVQGAGTGNTNYGWFGHNQGYVERIDYSNDSHSIRGSMSAARYSFAATGGFPG